MVAIHFDPRRWGWNARAASSRYIAIEFSQSLPSQPISDAQVRAFAWYYRNVLRNTWPGLPDFMPSHAEVERSGETGVIDGKSDAFPFGDQRMNDLRNAIRNLI